MLDQLLKILQDVSGLGTEKGVFWMDLKSRKIHSVPGMDAQYTFSLSLDKEGNVIAATRNGLYECRQLICEPYFSDNSLSNISFYSFYADNNGISWSGTESGLLKIVNRNVIKKFTVNDGFF